MVFTRRIVNPTNTFRFNRCVAFKQRTSDKGSEEIFIFHLTILNMHQYVIGAVCRCDVNCLPSNRIWILDTHSLTDSQSVAYTNDLKLVKASRLGIDFTTSVRWVALRPKEFKMNGFSVAGAGIKHINWKQFLSFVQLSAVFNSQMQSHPLVDKPHSSQSTYTHTHGR